MELSAERCQGGQALSRVAKEQDFCLGTKVFRLPIASIHGFKILTSELQGEDLKFFQDYQWETLPCDFLHLFLKHLPLEAKPGLLAWLHHLFNEYEADVHLRAHITAHSIEPFLRSLGTPRENLEVFQVPLVPLWGEGVLLLL